ncbi:MAG: NRDE family protein [Myxococcota bacterium]
MCTLIALHRCTPDAPLVIAANRDEHLDRPAEGPALRVGGRHPVAAPRDLRAGGTWLGVNGAGLLAAVTNRPVETRDDSRRSRGQLVLEALEAGSVREAGDLASGIEPDAFNPFNLLVADGREALSVIYDGTARIEELAPGPHVICNADPDDRSVPKVARLLEEAGHAARLPGDAKLEALAEILRAHRGGPEPLGHTCIHARGYGTRSSTLLRLGPEAEAAWWFADGPPCQTRYEDYSHLLHQLDRGDEQVSGGVMTRSMV